MYHSFPVIFYFRKGLSFFFLPLYIHTSEMRGEKEEEKVFCQSCARRRRKNDSQKSNGNFSQRPEIHGFGTKNSSYFEQEKKNKRKDGEKSGNKKWWLKRWFMRLLWLPWTALVFREKESFWVETRKTNKLQRTKFLKRQEVCQKIKILLNKGCKDVITQLESWVIKFKNVQKKDELKF